MTEATESGGVSQGSQTTESKGELKKGLESSLDIASDKLRSENSYMFEVTGDDLGDLVKGALKHNSENVKDQGLIMRPEKVSVTSNRLLVQVDIEGKSQLVEGGKTEDPRDAQLHLILSNADGKLKSDLSKETYVDIDTRKKGIVDNEFSGNRIGEGISGYLGDQMRARGVSSLESTLAVTEDGHLKVEVKVSAESYKSAEEIFREAYLKGLNERPGDFGDIGDVYKSGQDSARDVDEPGELEKLIGSIKTLHSQTGLDEYKPQIEVVPGALDDQKRQITKDRVFQDFNNLADKVVDNYFLKDYKEQQDRINSLIDGAAEVKGGGHDRVATRDVAYKLAREYVNESYLHERMLVEIGDEELGDEVVAAGKRKRYVEEGFQSIDDRPEEERGSLIVNRVDKLRNELTDDEVNSFNNLGDERKMYVKNLQEVELNIAHQKKEWERAMSSSNPEDACKVVANLGYLELERKRGLSELNLALSAQRVMDSVDSSRDDLGDAISRHGIFNERTRETFKGAVGNLTSSYSELVGKSLDVAKSLEVFDKPQEAVSAIKDGAKKAINTVHSAYREHIADKLGRGKKRVADVVESARQRVLSEKDGGERVLIDVYKKHEEGIYKLLLLKNRVVTQAGVEAVTAGKRVRLSMAEKLVTDEQERQKLNDRKEGLVVARERLLKWKALEFEETVKTSPGPDYSFLDARLDQQIDFISKEEEVFQKATTVATDEVSVPKESSLEDIFSNKEEERLEHHYPGIDVSKLEESLKELGGTERTRVALLIMEIAEVEDFVKSQELDKFAGSVQRDENKSTLEDGEKEVFHQAVAEIEFIGNNIPDVCTQLGLPVEEEFEKLDKEINSYFGQLNEEERMWLEEMGIREVIDGGIDTPEKLRLLIRLMSRYREFAGGYYEIFKSNFQKKYSKK
jgi:hypothetical protein